MNRQETATTAKEEMRYLDELKKASRFLGEKPDVIFIGQNTVYPGSVMSKTFMTEVLSEKRIELPVFENTQVGLSIGLALAGFVPVTVFGRPNFLLYGLGPLINELDKFSAITGGKVSPKVIIKVMNGSERPIDPGVQHKGDFTEVFKLALPSLEVIRLDRPEQVFGAYKRAYERTDGKSTLIVEWGDYYNEK